MKKIISLLCAVAAVCSLMTTAVAESNSVDVYVDGKLAVYDPPAMIYNQRTMIPLRAVSETLGWDVEWDAEAGVAYIMDNERGVTLGISPGVDFIGKAVLDEEAYKITIDTPPIMYDSRLFIPVRAVAEALDVEVGWEAETRSVIVTTFEGYVSSGEQMYKTNYGTATTKGYESEELGIRFINKEGFVMTPINKEIESNIEMIALDDEKGNRVSISCEILDRPVTADNYLKEIVNASQEDSQAKSVFLDEVQDAYIAGKMFRAVFAQSPVLPRKDHGPSQDTF